MTNAKHRRTYKKRGGNSNSSNNNVVRKNSGSYGFNASADVGSKFKKTLSKPGSRQLTKQHSNSLTKTLSTKSMTKLAINIDYDNLMKKFVNEFETKIKDLKTLVSNLKSKMSDAQSKKFKDTIEEINNLIQDSQGQKDDMENNFLKNHQKNTKPYKAFTDSNDYIDALFEIQKTSCNLKMAITDKINILRDKLKVDNNKFRLFTRKTRKPLTYVQKVKIYKDAAGKKGRIITFSDAEKEMAKSINV